MSLILVLTNDGTGTDESANYRWAVYVNSNRLFAGRTTGHNRKNGMWGLLAQLAIEQLGIAGAESYSAKGVSPFGVRADATDALPPDSVPGAMSISLIRQMVFNYPSGMEGWQCCRIEYGGHAENCLCEGTIWLPPDCDPDSVERFLQRVVDGKVP